ELGEVRFGHYDERIAYGGLEPLPEDEGQREQQTRRGRRSMTLDRARDKLVTGPEFAQQRGAHAVGLGTPGRRVLPRLLGEYRELVELQHEEGGEVEGPDLPRIIEILGVIPPQFVTVFVERYGAARR